MRRFGFYHWLLPTVWLPAFVTAYFHPGDEYAFFFVGSMAGAWIVHFITVGDVKGVVLPIGVTGVIVLAAVGYLKDRLRINVRLWLGLWLIAGLALLWNSLRGYESMERAISKNGSLTAYAVFAWNFGLYLAVLASIAIHAIMILVQRLWPPSQTREHHAT